MTSWIDIDGRSIQITKPEKIMWPDMGITKVDYLKTLIEIGPFLVPHSANKQLATVREGGRKEPNATNLNSRATLLFLANLDVLEFHAGLKKFGEIFLPSLVFELVPNEGQSFEHVVEVALTLHAELEVLHIKSFPKTSGMDSLQIFIPLERKYTYEEGKRFHTYFAEYFAKKYPHLITLEQLLYWDDEHSWRDKKMICVYSPLAIKGAPVSTPITWEELEKGIKPEDFNLLNITARLKEKGELFSALLTSEGEQNIDFLNEHVYSTWDSRFL
ncbi:MAG: DNA polymerase domain-containing protein [Vallitaleaceae bacterium]|nr:DNA polymerase domain-containing protein [Vallitaleaceae bacterium]